MADGKDALHDAEVVGAARGTIFGSLSDEQAQVVRADLTRNRLVSCVAVAGAGKTRTAAALVVNAMIETGVGKITVMSSMRSAANTALVRINETLQSSGLAARGVVFKSQSVRTVHSLARAANMAAGRPHKIVTSVDSYLTAAIDEKLAPIRLDMMQCASFAEFWSRRDSGEYVCDLDVAATADEVVQDEESVAGDETYGLKLYKRMVAAHDPAITAEGFSEVTESELLTSLRVVRTELMDKGVPLSTTQHAKSHLIARANELMNNEGKADHVASICAFADSEEPVCGEGHVLVVDEAQDLTYSQAKIVQSTLKAGACVVLLGDPSQGVMVFAGSSSNPIAFLQAWAAVQSFTVEKFRLSVNYRSSAEIVEASEAVLPAADLAIRGQVSATFRGEPFVLLNPKNEKDEATQIGKRIEAMLKTREVAAGEIAVLSFGNFSWDGHVATALRNFKIPFLIRGRGKDAAAPAMRLLPAIQVAIGLEEFYADTEDQASALQTFVRAIGCTFSEDVRKYVSEVATARQLGVLQTFIDFTQDIIAKSERDYPSVFSGKRDVYGKKIYNKNTRRTNISKAALVARDVVKHVSSWMAAASEGQVGAGGAFTAVGAPVVKDGAVTKRLPVKLLPPHLISDPTTPLASVAYAIASSFVEVDSNRMEELDRLIASLTVQEPTLDEFVGVVALELARQEAVEEKDGVVLSTIHKFKGSERHCVIVVGINSRFDRVGVSSAKTQAYSGLHEDSCPTRAQGCACLRFKAQLEKMKKENALERLRLAHVALSRARRVLVVSAPGEVGPSFLRLRMLLD